MKNLSFQKQQNNCPGIRVHFRWFGYGRTILINAEEIYTVSCYTANMRRCPNVGLLLGHRLRRWLNNKPTFDQHLLFVSWLRQLLPVYVQPH